MKKQIFMGLALAATLGLAACSDAKTSTAAAPSTQSTGDSDKAVLYSGILPSADALGTVYTLKLDFDDDNNYTDGDYVLIENSLAADENEMSGLKEVATSYSEGDFRKETKEVNGEKVEYIVLAPDAKDALGVESAGSLYFLVNADGSLTMTGADLTKPEGAEYYTLAVK